MEIDLLNNDLFKEDKIEFPKNVNFLYGRNGTGKSTLTKEIATQFGNSDDYKVFAFQGFENLLHGNDKLNAIVLGEENVEIEKQIEKYNKSIEELNKKISGLSENIDEDNLSLESLGYKCKDAKKAYDTVRSNLDSIATNIARKIKNTSPQISKPTYNKNDFEAEISYAKSLSQQEIDKCNEVLRIKNLEAIPISPIKWDVNKIYSAINQILQHQVQERVTIQRLEGNTEKSDFAKKGLEIHKAGDRCAFCGNIITQDTYEELNRYFSADEVKAFQKQIQGTMQQIKAYKTQINSIKIDEHQFYPSQKDEVERLDRKIEMLKASYNKFFDKISISLKDKEAALFTSVDILPQEIVPESINEVIKQYNDLVNKNNSSNISSMKENARNELRSNRIFELANEEKYNSVRALLKQKEGIKNKYVQDVEDEKKKIKDLENQKKEILCKITECQEKTRNEQILANKINEILKNHVSFELVLQKDRKNGYYSVKNIETGDIRSIREISTGEKNIIAFLYFLGKIKEYGEALKKIIVFDDPMSSNDDYLQYIIIDELQRLMKTKNSDDICIIMTHNKHFYLNVKYGWHYKPFNNQDKKVACFIRLMPDGNHSVIQYIDKKSEDFKTSYESLWKDLIFLYNNDDAPADLLLNPIRRIIETFLKFNAIESSEFYGNMPGVEKYFNVNSHSVDDLEAELNGKGKSEIMALMRECFEKNNLLPHFEHYFSKAL